MKGTFRILSLVFGAIAVVLLVIAGIFFGTTHHTLSTYDRTAGTVVAVDTTSGAVTQPGAYEGQPVVQYVVGGRSYRWVDPISSHPVSHDVGSTVTIAYDPDAPQKAKLPGPSSYLVSIITGSIGALFLLLSVAFLLVSLVAGRFRSSTSWASSSGTAVQAGFAFQTSAPAMGVPAVHAAGVDSVTDPDQPGGYPTVRVSWTDETGANILETTGPEAVGLYPGDQVWVRRAGGRFGGLELLHEKPAEPPAQQAPPGDQRDPRDPGDGGELPSVIQEL